MSGDSNTTRQANNGACASVKSAQSPARAIQSPFAHCGGEARGAPILDAMARRVFWELRHARLRLALAENDLAWAQELLVSGGIAPHEALITLDETMNNLCGVRP